MAEQTVALPQQAQPAESPMASTRDDSRYLIPPVDIIETDEGLTVVVDMPGVERDQASIRVDQGVLTIQGKISSPVHGDGLYNEFMLLDYFRQFQLGERVDQAKITAQLHNGVLCIQLPRVAEAVPRQIEVSVA